MKNDEFEILDRIGAFERGRRKKLGDKTLVKKDTTAISKIPSLDFDRVQQNSMGSMKRLEPYQFLGPLSHSVEDMCKKKAPRKQYQVNLKKRNVENYFRTQFEARFSFDFIETW